MYQAAIVGSKIPQAMAESEQPWVYVAGLLLVALLCVGGYTLNWLVKLDNTHRTESAKREERLNEQLDKSIAASSNIVDTQKEMIQAIVGVQNTMHDFKSETNNRFEKLEKTVNKESA